MVSRTCVGSWEFFLVNTWLLISVLLDFWSHTGFLFGEEIVRLFKYRIMDQYESLHAFLDKVLHYVN